MKRTKVPSSTSSRRAKPYFASERWPLIIRSRGPEQSATRDAWTYSGVPWTMKVKGFEAKILQRFSEGDSV